jgi:hypothetical protein
MSAVRWVGSLIVGPLVATALGTGGIAGAVPHSPQSVSRPIVRPASNVSPTAPPFSGGWVESVSAATGAASYEQVTAPTGIMQNGDLTIAQNGGTTTSQFPSDFSVPGGAQIGVVYATGAGSASIGSGECTGAFFYDAISPPDNGPVTTLGLEFEADCYANTGIFDTYYLGQVAINLPNDGGEGYYLYDRTGALYAFGNNSYLSFFGDLSFSSLNAPIVSMAVTPDGGGYWMLGSDGGIFSYGDAQFYGSTGGMALNKPIVSMTSTADGKGYWLVASDGGIFAFGDAAFYGSMGGQPLNKPIVGMAATPDGRGYWEVASDGGIFAFGDAPFYGSTGNVHLNRPIVGMTPTPDGRGYWFVASDGGIFSYGDASFFGSAGNLTLAKPIIAMDSTPDGRGYWLVASDGGVFSFGDAPFLGSLIETDIPVAGIVTS